MNIKLKEFPNKIKEFSQYHKIQEFPNEIKEFSKQKFRAVARSENPGARSSGWGGLEPPAPCLRQL